MKLRAIAEESALQTAGHVALDVAGLIPGWGEPADLANALWYAEEKQYLNAALSLLSMVPEIGDAIGKGAKYLGKGSKFVAKFISKWGDDIAKYWPKIVKMIEKMEEWRPYARILDQTIQDLLAEHEKGQGTPSEPAMAPMPT
jgi:hypothetical protein